MISFIKVVLLQGFGNRITVISSDIPCILNSLFCKMGWTQ